MYEIIETGGKQYKVAVGDKVEVELLDATEGKALSFAGLLNGAAVSAKVLSHGRGEKINIFTYKPKKRVRRHIGHRQPFTLIEITEIKAQKEASAK
jgi:large subunit ribosomal protein L21